MARKNSNVANNNTAKIGSPTVSQREGAGCSSRPQWGQTTNSADALWWQRRQRILRDLASSDSPHSGQIVAWTLTVAPQLGQGRTPAVLTPDIKALLAVVVSWPAALTVGSFFMH